MTNKALIVGVVGGLVMGMLFKKLALGLLIGLAIAYLLYRSTKPDADADQR